MESKYTRNISPLAERGAYLSPPRAGGKGIQRESAAFHLAY